MAQMLKRCCWLAVLLGSVSAARGQQSGVETADSPAAPPQIPDSNPVGIVRLRQWQHDIVRTAGQDVAPPLAASPAPGEAPLPIISPRGTPPRYIQPAPGVVRLTHTVSEERAPAPFPDVFLPPTPIPPLAEIVVEDIHANVVVFPKGDTEWRAASQPVTTVADLADGQLIAPVQNTADLWAQLEPQLAAPPAEAAPLPIPPETTPIAGADEQRRLSRLEQLQRPLGTITVSSVNPLEGPADQAAAVMAGESPLWIPSGGWANPPVNRYPVCFQHQPLYFEEVNLERCGWGHGVFQPICSSATFLGNTAMLPVHMLADHPKDCVPTLGDCPTCHRWTMEQLLWKLDEE